MTAARTGKVDAVKVLLRYGADVNAKEGWHGQTALMWAAAEGHPAVIRSLVEAGADIRARSQGGFTALLFAAREGQIGAVQACWRRARPERILARQEPRPRDAHERRRASLRIPKPASIAFLLAAANAHYRARRVLLDRGADPNAAPQGWTALHQVSWVRKAGMPAATTRPPRAPATWTASSSSGSSSPKAPR